MAKTTDTTVNSKEDIRIPQYTRETMEQKNNQKKNRANSQEQRTLE